MHTSFDKTLLYFLPGPTASDEDKQIAKALMFKLEAQIKFRNGSVDMDGGRPEKCDYVYGAAPIEYRKTATTVDSNGNVISGATDKRENVVALPTEAQKEADVIAAEVGAAPVMPQGWGAPKTV